MGALLLYVLAGARGRVLLLQLARVEVWSDAAHQ
jgi:hypothetical protein